jgi:riboflavin synthase
LQLAKIRSLKKYYEISINSKMFTGLIESLGEISNIDRDLWEIVLLKPEKTSIISDLAIGDSVAVDGVCLTVETILTHGFMATASPETLQRTTLGTRDRAAKYVNLETSLRVGSKIGGHFVTGHIDSLGRSIESISTGSSWEMRFGIPAGMEAEWQERIARYLVAKGSIAVNGISLTIADLDSQGTWFTAAVIPHTYTETNLSCLEAGDLVNLEVDILGKYVDKLIGHRLPNNDRSTEISLAFLTENGYF